MKPPTGDLEGAGEVDVTTHAANQPLGNVELFWLPLGAGDRSRLVRWTGRVFEALVARRQHRPRCDLYLLVGGLP